MNQCFLSLSENCSMKWVFQYLHWTATCVQYLGTVVQALITVLRVRSQTHQVWIQRHRQWSQGVSVDLSRQDSLLLQTGFIWQEAPETSHLNHLEPRAESHYTCQHVVFSVVLHSIFFFFNLSDVDHEQPVGGQLFWISVAVPGSYQVNRLVLKVCCYSVWK